MPRRTGADHVDVWGTGSSVREFLFVDDAAEGIVVAAERTTEAEPVNLGTDEELPHPRLVKLVAGATGVRGRDPVGHHPSPTASPAPGRPRPRRGPSALALAPTSPQGLRLDRGLVPGPPRAEAEARDH